jgi:hypothetical protein
MPAFIIKFGIVSSAMKIFLLAITLLLRCHQTYAQNDKWTIKAGDEAQMSLPDSIRFLYPKFIPGRVYFRDGKISNAVLNYNLMNGEMEFIAAGNDTLSIANEVTIRLITVNNDSFYYDKGYMKLITGNASIKLAKKELIQIGDVEKMSAYIQSSSTSAISTMSYYYSSRGEVNKLKSRADVLLVKQTVYYFGDRYNHFLLANKKNLKKILGRNQSELETFLQENKIMFSREDDLIKLTNFTHHLN